MKTKIITILITLFALSSCNQKIGSWDDIIQLSKTKHTFDAEGGNFTVTTKGKAWTYDVYCNGETYVSEKGYMFHFYETSLPDTIKGPWFWVAWQEEKMFIIHADANDSDNKRSFTLTLPAGDYFGHVYITQKGKAN